MSLWYVYLVCVYGVVAEYAYNDLCDSPTVLFKPHDGHSCVCFNHGSYELESCNGEAPGYFSPAFEPECVVLPNTTIAITRLSELVDSTVSLPSCTKKHTRVKREAAIPDIPDNPSHDEDQAGAGVEIGTEVMRDQMNHYIERKIAQLTGLNNEGGGTDESSSRSKYPVIKLLDYSKQIMAKTCTVVSEDFLDLALNAFVNLQLETYHIKEPYIGYSAYRRIEQAMEKCLLKAAPHVFWNNLTTETGTNEFCEEHLADRASDMLVADAKKPSEDLVQISVPAYASAALNDTAITEPLIEAVWKMLVNAHSFCYVYFSDYFNDHHTYTVALLPMFTNKIQEIWLQGYMLGPTHPDNILYGGLLGDVKKIMQDIDYCTGASKEASPYPWFMNRPPRDKSNVWRKKRDASNHAQSVSVHTVAKQHIIQFDCLPQNVNICSSN